MTISATLQLPLKSRKPSPAPHETRLHVLWLLLSTSLLAFIANYALGNRAPALSHVLEIASCVSCGLSWLLARALFRSDQDDARWPYGVVAILFSACVILYTTRVLGLPRVGLLGFVGQVTAMMSSTMLLLPIFEAIDGFGRSDARERQFRGWFLAGYACILTAAIMLSTPAFAAMEHQGQVMCCIFALMAIAVSVHYRKHLQAEKSRARQRPHRLDQNASHLAIGVMSLLEQDRVFLNPEIKVSDLARRLRTPEYKVTRCITGPLGFRNFNQMINRYRIEEAKRLLMDTRFDEKSILAIAMDSGFGSIGPFNRAFKLNTGQTPLAFRKARANENMVHNP
ncbi:MAG: helix-turn-helix domain-containing protein [Pseudomonadota bacterium]